MLQTGSLMTATRTSPPTLTQSWRQRCRQQYTARRRSDCGTVGKAGRKEGLQTGEREEGREDYRQAQVRLWGGRVERKEGRVTDRRTSDSGAGRWKGRKGGLQTGVLRRGLGCQAGGARLGQVQVGLSRMPRRNTALQAQALSKRLLLITTSPDNALRAVQGVADGQAPTPLREGDRKDLTSSQGGPPQERGGTMPWHAALQLRSTPSDNATASGAGAGAGHGAGGLAGGERGGAAVVELNLASEPSLSRGRLADGVAGERGGGGSGGLGHGGLNLGGPLHQVQRSRTHAQLDLSGPAGGGGLAPDRPPRSGGAAMSSGPGFSLNLGGPHAPAQQRQHQRDSAAQLSNLGRSRDSLGAGGSGAGANGGDELNPHAPSRMASDTAHTLADFDQDVRPIGRKRLGSAAGERHIPVWRCQGGMSALV